MKFDLKNIIEKFNYNPNSVKKNYDGKTDVYLAKVSYRYSYIKRILTIILTLVIIAFLLSGNITYSNFYYLVKDVKLASDFVNSVHDTITYNVGNSQSFVAYRSGIAVASREKFSIFSAGGREIFASNHVYANPSLLASSKYILLYDVGGKQYALYNSFSKLEEEILDYPIYGGSLSESGSFALITKSDRYDSVVSVYQESGSRYDFNFADGRVSSVSLSKNGHELAVLLVFSNTNQIKTELRLYKIGSSNYSKKELTFSKMPYEVKIFDNGNIVVVGADGVNAFNSSLSQIGEYTSDKEIYAYALGDDNIAISHLSNSQGITKVVVFNNRGKIEKTYEYSERVIDVVLCDDYLFIQRLSGFERINTSVNASKRIDMMETGFKMIPSDKDTLIICNDSYAKFLNFGR